MNRNLLCIELIKLIQGIGDGVQGYFERRGGVQVLRVGRSESFK